MSGSINKNIIALNSYSRAIVHIDCDAFFASCEQAREPRLKNKPVVTGKERGIISSASYEAKACGVKRGIQLSEAKRLCPNLIILPSDYETYSLYSERMFQIVRRFTPSVEEFSIDETFCDITGLRRVYRASYPAIARKIKDQIQKELDITVSAGISSSKTLAKICSRFNKPDGFVALPGRKLHLFLKGVPLDMVCGFGRNTAELLNKCGVRDVLDYVNLPVNSADGLLGKTGVELWHELRGRAVYAINEEKKNKYLSISKTKTFMPASNSRDIVKAQLVKNLESACIKLRRHKLSAGRLTVYLRTSDFNGFAVEAKMNRNSSATLDLSKICAVLFEKIFKKGIYYRATGVVLAGITPDGVNSLTLFDDPVKISRIKELSKIIDGINKKYGKHSVHLAVSDRAMTADSCHPRNSLPWRKNEFLKGESFRRHLNIPLLKL